MNKLIIPFLFIACLFMACCHHDDEPKDRVKEIYMTISAETGFTYAWPDDHQEYPIECMMVKVAGEDDEWRPMCFGEIEGFTYMKGHEYYLLVKKTILANPQADGSNCTYSLVKILSNVNMNEPEGPEEAGITSLSEIRYQEGCPFDKYAIETLYYVDQNGTITYSWGDNAPSYDSARIWMEDVLPKDDPNWIKFEKVPYMAIYSFVSSPLAEKIRLVRNDHSGPLFMDVVPEDEFNYIVKDMQVNEELEYTLVLANVYKLGLQKLSFKIKKK